MIYHYDGCGRVSRVFAGNLSLDFEYAASGDPTCVSVLDDYPACSGRLTRVTASDGRYVDFTYYVPGEPTGNPGDLKLATLAGKPGDTPRTWAYTYLPRSQNEEGSPCSSLLTKIIDPALSLMVHNIYGDHDQIKTQFRYGRRYDYGYEIPSDDYSTSSVNRSGQVRRFFYKVNAGGGGPLLVREREAVGTVPATQRDACAGMVGSTELIEQLAVEPVRGTTQALFRDTVYTYTDEEDGDQQGPDDEIRIRSITFPDGSTETRFYNYQFFAELPPQVAGNEVIKRMWGSQIHHITRTIPAVAGQPAVTTTESFFYDVNQPIGGSLCGCRFGQPSRRVDAENRETKYEYTGRRIKKITHPIVYTTTPGLITPTEEYIWNLGALIGRVYPPVEDAPPRRDEYSYAFLPGPDSSYSTTVRLAVVNGQPTAQRVYEHDGAGNVTRVVDEQGLDTLFQYNGFRELTMMASPIGPGGQRTTAWFRYDMLGNLIRIDTENRDDDGTLSATNPILTTIREYDIQSRLIRTASEAVPVDVPSGVVTISELANPTAFAVEEYEYDVNSPGGGSVPQLHQLEDLVTQIRSPAVALGQPGSAVKMVYDEWNQLYRVERGEGSSKRITQYDYDLAGRLSKITEGVGGAPGAVRVTTLFPDGLGRVPRVVQPDGTIIDKTFDKVGNVRSVEVRGPLDQLGGANVLLSRLEYDYDAMRRVMNVRRFIFDPATGLPAQPQISTTTFVYHANSSLALVVDPYGKETSFRYDTLHRLWLRTDPLGNSVEHAYDPTGNLTELLTRDINPSTGAPRNQTTRTVFDYDVFGQTTNIKRYLGGGSFNTTQFTYDSRGNIVSVTDPRSKVTRYEYDPLSRLVATRRQMDSGPDIVTTQTWDLASRLIAQTDDNGNTTRYAYDDFDRVHAVRIADGTLHQVGEGAVWPDGAASPSMVGTSGFDALGNALVVSYGKAGHRVRAEQLFDNMGRVTQRNSTLLDEASLTVQEHYTYDGMGRLRRAWARDDSRSTKSMIERRYDSLSRVVSEAMDFDPPSYPQFNPALPNPLLYEYDLTDRTTQALYPSGRQVMWPRDELRRVAGVWDLPPPPPGQYPQSRQLAAFTYAGADRLVRRTNLANNTTSTWSHNGILGDTFDLLQPNDPDLPPPGDFGAGRVTRVTHSNSPTTPNPTPVPFDAWTLRWDRSNNKVARTQIGTATFAGAEALYGYDAIDRLISAAVNVSGEQGSKDPRFRVTESYTLDGVHNRVNVSNGPMPGAYALGVTGSSTRRLNQYSASPLNQYLYDGRGNMRAESSHCRGDIAPKDTVSGDFGDHRV
ncbi:MAG: hypothetical protein ACKVZJ_14765, partial [Phycisphaerales bacterium]